MKLTVLTTISAPVVDEIYDAKKAVLTRMKSKMPHKRLFRSSWKPPKKKSQSIRQS